MDKSLGSICYIFLVIAWVMGFVIAKGFLSTVFCIFPLWAWYLTAERVLTHYHLLGF